MEFRGVMGGFYRVSEWIMRLSVINLLWIVCGLPFFGLAFLLLYSPSVDAVMQTLILMALVSPITLFPSTAAMFTVVRKWVTGEEDAPLFKTFFRGYKENFVQSLLGGLIYLILAAILYSNLKFYGAQDGIFGILRFLALALSVLLFISMFHFFSIVTHLRMKLLQIIKNAVLLTLGSPVRSLSMALLIGLILYISFGVFTFLIPFFTGSLIAVVAFWHFNMIFGKLQEKQQEWAERDAEAQQDQETIAAGEEPNGASPGGGISLSKAPDESDKREP